MKPNKPKWTQIDPHLDHEVGVHILFTEAAFDFGCCHFAFPSTLQWCNLLKSPKKNVHQDMLMVLKGWVFSIEFTPHSELCNYWTHNFAHLKSEPMTQCSPFILTWHSVLVEVKTFFEVFSPMIFLLVTWTLTQFQKRSQNWSTQNYSSSNKFHPVSLTRQNWWKDSVLWYKQKCNSSTKNYADCQPWNIL